MGAALGRRLAGRGIEVWLAARREDRLTALAEAIVADGGRAHPMALDIADARATFDRIVALDEETGGIDLVVANAGIAGLPAAIPISRCRWDDVESLLRVNVEGTLATLVALVPRMLERGHGHLVATSSLTPWLPNPRTAPYGAGKAALTYFMRSIDIELAPRGIAVSTIHPGFVATEAAAGVEEPMPWLVSEERAAAIIDRGIRRRARDIRFPRRIYWLAGALGLLPRFLYDPLSRHLSRER